METLDEKGFVFIDDKNMPYWVAIRYNKPMLAYWHKGQNSWVNLRPINQTEIWIASEKKLSENLANMYHDLHEKFNP